MYEEEMAPVSSALLVCLVVGIATIIIPIHSFTFSSSSVLCFFLNEAVYLGLFCFRITGLIFSRCVFCVAQQRA